MIRRLLVLSALFFTLTACKARSESSELRLGYMANLTHAQALLGVGEGAFQKALGSTRLRAVVVHAGPQAIEAVFAGQLDMAYVGPNPAINGFLKSRGRALQIVSGAAANGVAFVVQPELKDRPIAQWKGKRFGAPQIGGSQDVALRTWLKDHGLDPAPGGDVTMTPASGADLFNLFRKQQIAGAWVPEPWAARLMQQAGGVAYLYESTLWPDETHPTTVVIAAVEYLEKHPDSVRRLLEAHAALTRRIQNDKQAALDATAAQVYAITKVRLPRPVLEQAFANIVFSTAISEPALVKAAADAAKLGYLRSTKLDGIRNLQYLPAAK